MSDVGVARVPWRLVGAVLALAGAFALSLLRVPVVNDALGIFN